MSSWPGDHVGCSVWDKGSFRATEILLTMEGAEVGAH